MQHHFERSITNDLQSLNFPVCLYTVRPFVLVPFQISPSLSVSLPLHPQTILGDFQKEQEKFVQEKNAKKTGKDGYSLPLFIYFKKYGLLSISRILSLLPFPWTCRRGSASLGGLQ